MTELRRRMFEELRLRNYSPNTITVYIRCVANFAQHFRLSPDRLGPEHIREYQLFLVQRKRVSWPLFNQTVCALRFFYHHILHRDWMIEHIPYPRHEAKLPVVLSPTEVASVFEATSNFKDRTILMTIYAAGLRVSEVTHLRVSDIDSQRQVICVRQGKGHRDRQVMLSPRLLELLRTYWKSYRPKLGHFDGGRGRGVRAANGRELATAMEIAVANHDGANPDRCIIDRDDCSSELIARGGAG